jgi:hypothetical protein
VSPLETIRSLLTARECRPRRGASGLEARCPAHEDRRASLSVSEAHDGRALLKCHAGCEVAAILKALGLELRDLFPPREESARGTLPPRKRRIRARYLYCDAKGERLFEVARFDDAAGEKCRPWRPWLPERERWKSLNGTPRPLYRLPELVEAVKAARTIFIPEGEKDVETVRALGLDATTNPGGAEGWRAEYAAKLIGADVVILPDNDEPGRKHGDAIARSLAGKARRVRVLELPGLLPKGDVSDWIAAGHTREELLELAERAGEKQEQSGEPERGAETEREPSAAAQLIAIGREAELFHDERSDGYAALESEGRRRVLRIRGGDFGDELRRRFAKKHGYKRAAGGEDLGAARGVLESLAKFEGTRHELSNRYARHEGAIYIDMADAAWRAIRVTPAGWEIVSRPPLLFRRYAHQAPLPEPERGGDVAAILEPFRMDEDAQILALAWLVTAPVANIPRPVLLPHGPQGAGKTTLAKALRSVLDPSGTPTLKLPSDEAERARILDSHAVPLFDNVSFIGKEASDELCTAVTGGGFEKRRLYTDEDVVILSYRRAVILNGINVPATAPDLLDRCLLVQLDRIPPEHRRREEELLKSLEAERPRVLGALLDALAGAMRRLPTLELPRTLPRMADFASWGAAVAEELGLGARRFLSAYAANVARQTEEVLESDPVARAVRELVSDRGTWEGSASELFALLKQRHGDETKTEGWPKRAEVLAKRIRTLHSTFADCGLSLRWDRSKTGRRMTLAAVGPVEAAAEPSTSSPRHQPARAANRGGDGSGDGGPVAVTPVVTSKPVPEAAGDGVDGNDGAFVSPTEEGGELAL